MTRTRKATQSSVADKAFARGLARLRAFIVREGHCRVPPRHVEPDGFRLGTWVWLRRQMHRRSILLAAHAASLTRLRGWSWDPRRDHFLSGVRALSAFAKREGHTWVPWMHRENAFPLGSWVHHLRLRVEHGQCSEECVRLVEAVPAWTPTPGSPREASFLERLELLRKMARRRKAAPGRAADYRNDKERALARWVARMRKKHRRGTLKPEWAAALETVPGWTWEPLEASWQRGLAGLRLYAAQKGHTRIPSKVLWKGIKLRVWAQNQRASYRRGELPRERVRALEGVSGWSWNPSLSWSRRR